MMLQNKRVKMGLVKKREVIDEYEVLEALIANMNKDEYSKIIYAEIKDDFVLEQYDIYQLNDEKKSISSIIDELLKYSDNLNSRIKG